MKKLISTLVLALIVNFTLIIDNCFSQWVQFSGGMGNKDVKSLAYSGTKIFAGTYSNGVYLSTNNGANWTQTSLNNRDVRGLAIIGNNVIAGTLNYGIYFSTNNGANWTQSNLVTEDVRTLAVGGNNVFAGTDHTGVYISTNNGTSWSQTSMNNITINSLFISGNNILAAAGVGGWGVFLSPNNGNSWSLIANLNVGTYAVSSSGNYIYAATAGPNGFYSSSDYGVNWTQTSYSIQNVVTIAASNNNVFTGSEGYSIDVSNNNGTNWIHRSEGLGSAYISALCIINNYIYAGTGNGVYRRPLSELIGINQISTEIPSAYSLGQNYPNPFNPTTKIRFEIPNGIPSLEGYAKRGVGMVTLKVFDITGREVATLVNEKLQPGTYETTFDGTALSSGTYFYKLTSGDFTATKKLTLLK